MEVYDYIRSDLERRISPTFPNFIRTYFSFSGCYFRYQVWLRIVHFSKQGKISRILVAPFAYLILHHYEYKYGIHANTNIHIGKGLKIVHGGGIHLNCSSIGDNFTVYQEVTFGTRHSNKDIPKVEDNVTVYPHAVICGSIVIHKGG